MNFTPTTNKGYEMKRLIKKLLKDKGYKGRITWNNHNEFIPDSNGYYRGLHHRILDIDYDIDNIIYEIERDGYNELFLYLEPKSYYDYQTKLNDKTHIWTEGEINQLRKSLGICSIWSKAAIEELLYAIRDGFEFRITPEQTEKGLNWLLKSQFRMNGKLRESQGTFIDERAADIVRNFSHFLFIGIQMQSNNPYNSVYSAAPIYRCFDKDGHYFDYNPVAYVVPEIVNHYYKEPEYMR